MQSMLERALLDTNSKAFYIVSDVLALTTIISILSIVLETVPSFATYQTWFLVIEWTAVLIFSLEYCGRLWVTTPKRKYVFSFFGLIDLISILPSFIGFANLTFLKSARALRLIRLLRMVRLAKLKHLKKGDADETMGYYTINVLLFSVVLIGSVLLVGTLMYLVEGNQEAFVSIPLSMLWAFKVFLVGLPIAYPESFGGELVHIFARFVGLLVLGVLIGVAGNVMKEALFSDKK